MGRCWDSVRELMEAHAALGARAFAGMPDWAAAEELVGDFFALSRAEEARLAGLFERSNGLFAPLGDPLGTDFSRHRQLVSGRDEVYADWFAWVLETVGEPGLIGRILGTARFAGVQAVEITREEGVPQIVIRAGEERLAVIEVMTETGESACPTRSWANVCFELRRIACGRAGGAVGTALILGFVGAVEQNVLGFAWPAADHGKAPRMASYLSKFLQAEEKMEKQQAAVSDEIKNFLQTGLRAYAPGCLALAEFRRQVLFSMQSVLEESADAFAALGIPVRDLRPVDQKLDDPDIDNKSWQIAFKTNHGDGVYSGYSVVCELEEIPEKQIWVEAWIHVGRQAERDQLFGALQQVTREAGFFLDQFSDGTAQLYCYGNPERFWEIGETFRGLIREWARMLRSAGGIGAGVAEQKELALAAGT